MNTLRVRTFVEKRNRTKEGEEWLWFAWDCVCDSRSNNGRLPPLNAVRPLARDRGEDVGRRGATWGSGRRLWARN